MTPIAMMPSIVEVEESLDVVFSFQVVDADCGIVEDQNPDALSGCAWCSPPDGLKGVERIFRFIMLSHASRRADD